ncbi:MAG: fasciclin domain-containing protein [Janthinobacterium lividum]
MNQRTRAVWPLVLAVVMPVVLAGCESTARQDPLFVRPSADTLVFHDTALFRDRTIDESVRGSLELADYSTALSLTGLLTELQRPGPYTVFAIPNEPLEAAQSAQGGRLLDPAALPSLRRLMAYTVVPGFYPVAALRQMIAKQGPVGLRTIDGDVLTVSVEAATGQLLLSDAQGHSNRIWLSSMPQSNGVLYATQSMLTPGVPAGQPAPVVTR